MRFQCDRYCPTVLIKCCYQFKCPYMVLLRKWSRIIRRNVKSVDRLLSCHWCSSKSGPLRIFFFLNYQLFDILRDSLRTPSGNLYIMGLLLYIHSRHLANYLRAKVCLSTRDTTKVAIPFFQGTCNADWLVEERDTCTNTETVYKARGICLGVRVGTIHKNLIHRWDLC